ncbi:MAG: hypothetical protein ABR980_03665 [Ignavibacteriaceae bacterium]|jgi:serine acetyltransferase
MKLKELLCSFGSGATTSPNLMIGKNSYVSSGAILMNNLNENGKMVGCPSKRIPNI